MAFAAATPFGYASRLALDEGRRLVDGLLKRLKADKYTLCLSDRSRVYFRHAILPSYKSHRTQGSVPEGLEDCKDLLTYEFEAMVLPQLEADDCCGILATQEDMEDDAIVVSSDKDLETIPGYLYKPHRDETLLITEEQADYSHLLQTLSGDSCDGFKGCPRVGPVRARAILGDKPCWDCVVRAYEKRGLNESDALTQARVARILRSSDWDSTNNQPILWSPPSAL